jgi:hypothetical protein
MSASQDARVKTYVKAAPNARISSIRATSFLCTLALGLFMHAALITA